MSTLHDYQVDHLLLLVGSNPLPNAVAGRLLTTPAGTITLICSAEGRSAKKDQSDDPEPDDSPSLVQRLTKWFRERERSNSDVSYSDISYKEVKEADADSVRKCVYELLNEYERKMLEKYQREFGDVHNAPKVRLGLNYTGGTKVMSVHAYRALESWVKEPHRHAIIRGDPVFSYLDARTLKMRFDPAIGGPTPPFYASLRAKMSIGELLAMHNWELTKRSDGKPIGPKRTPVLLESAATLLRIHANSSHVDIWKHWLSGQLFQVAWDQARKKWKRNEELRDQKIPWPPNLTNLEKTMRKELGQGAELNLTTRRGRGYCATEQDFCDWLKGTWLESAVLGVLEQCTEQLYLNDYGMDIKLKVRNSIFQFDVAAMRGYQLFAFSCSTTRDKGLLKQKLFEASMRAQQMGGDEACTALVCCAEEEDVKELEAEMRRDIIVKGRIKVFGRDCLKDLSGQIAEWISEQSRDPEQRPTGRLSKEV